MAWHFYPLSCIITFLGCAIAAFVAVKAWRSRPAPGAQPTAMLMLAIFLWTLFAGLEDASAALSIKLLFYDAMFVCIAAVPIIWLIMLLDYLGHRRLLKWRNIVLVSIVPYISIMLCWTNASHHLMFTQCWIEMEAGIPYLQLVYNIGFWIFIAYSYLLVFLGLIMCLLVALSSAKLYRQQAILLLIAGLVPLIVSVFDFSYLVLPEWNLTPTGFLFTGGALIWGMHRWRLLDLTPVAYQAMIQKMIDGIFVVDANQRITDINPAGCTMLGMNSGALIGQPITVIASKLPGLSSAQFGQRDEQFVSEVPEAAPTAYDVRVTPLMTSPQNSVGWLVVLRDITERRQLEQQLHALAYYDALTGLPNRVLLRDRLEHTIASNRRHAGSAGVIFIDLDRFKEINDTFGHPVGDAVLQQAGQRLKNTLRSCDTVARFGGDEFVLIVTDTPTPAKLVDTSQRIMDAFNAPFLVQEHAFQLTPSLGLTMTPADGDTVDDLLRNADIAMYRAKSAGGAGHAFYADTVLVADDDLEEMVR